MKNVSFTSSCSLMQKSDAALLSSVAPTVKLVSFTVKYNLSHVEIRKGPSAMKKSNYYKIAFKMCVYSIMPTNICKQSGCSQH